MSKPVKNSNVIQFPGAKVKKETNESLPVGKVSVSDHYAPYNPPTLPVGNKQTKESAEEKTWAQKALLPSLLITIAMASLATNTYIFDSSTLISMSKDQSSRSIASTSSENSFKRNTDWEHRLARDLASVKTPSPGSNWGFHNRTIASSQVGRPASLEEQLRFGVLEEKYTIKYSSENHRIERVELQDPQAEPTYIVDRASFLKNYGKLFANGFSSSELVSSQSVNDRILEAHVIWDSEQKTKVQVEFELDRHKRLLSLKVNSENP